MRRVPASVTLAVVLSAVTCAFGVCPVMMVSGMGERDNIVVTFRNSGKLPIRQLEFDCSPPGSHTQVQKSSCREMNALFYPGMQYTVRYPYPGGSRRTVTVAVKSVTLSDGFVWKPSRKQLCRTIGIVARKTR